MGYYSFPAYIADSQPRYIVVWSMHWAVIACKRIEPGDDLSAAMDTTIARLDGEGWRAESGAEYGFTFLSGQDERRLLIITPCDPSKTARYFL